MTALPPGAELLAGGVGNAGAVWRLGDVVHRPASAHSAAIHALLRHLHAHGCDGVPEVLGIGADGRERLRFVPGEVAIPPFPSWAEAEPLLRSAAALLRRVHDAQRGLTLPDGATWSDEMVDPEPGVDPVICHNDACLENLVVRDGEVVALIDWEFAAPGRRAWDLAALARYLVPVDDPVTTERLGRPVDRDVAARLLLAIDAYGLVGDERAEVVRALGTQIERGGVWVRARVEAGEPAFVAMWEMIGGQDRFDRRRAWFDGVREDLLAAVA